MFWGLGKVNRYEPSAWFVKVTGTGDVTPLPAVCWTATLLEVKTKLESGTIASIKGGNTALGFEISMAVIPGSVVDNSGVKVAGVCVFGKKCGEASLFKI